MKTPPHKPALSNIQIELLRIFTVNIPEDHLIELRLLVARILLEKARDEADAVWDEKGYTDEKLKLLPN